MSVVPRPLSSFAPVSSLQLRQMLEKALPSDAQLEAFCIDCLPEVQRQFSGGMERTRKLNLILTTTETAVLLEHLRGYAPTITEHELKRAAPQLWHPAVLRRWTRRIIGLGSAVLGAMLVAVLVLGPCAQRNRSAGATAAAVDLAVLGSPTAVPLPWLTSEPSAALVYAVPSGRRLGQTPWSSEPTAPSDATILGGLQVCVRSAGFIPVLVRLEPGVDRSRPRPKHIRLQREPGAAEQHGLGQETCDVPIPIIE